MLIDQSFCREKGHQSLLLIYLLFSFIFMHHNKLNLRYNAVKPKKGNFEYVYNLRVEKKIMLDA